MGELSSQGSKEGERLSGGLVVTPARAPPRRTAVPPAAQTPDACGFTMHFLPKLVTLWSTLPTGSMEQPRNSAETHFRVEARHGDALRVLVAMDGWCDVLGRFSAEDGKWRPIARWHAPFGGGANVYAGIGLRHNTVATLRKTFVG